jgi:hypothetical protein
VKSANEVFLQCWLSVMRKGLGLDVWATFLNDDVKLQERPSDSQLKPRRWG